MSKPSYQEQLAILHAESTARLARLMGTTPPAHTRPAAYKNYVFYSGDSKPLGAAENDRRFWPITVQPPGERQRYLRVAYLTGWRDGLRWGLLAGVGAGMALAAALIALGLYGDAEGLRWLL